jgi:AraC-like DNA-binding protein
MIKLDKNPTAFIAVTRAREILDLEFSKRVTLESLARRLGYNRTDLQAHFKGRFAVTIHQYVVLRRIDAAKHLLMNTGWKVEAIAAEIGYQSKDAFYRSFRKSVGVAPHEYRRTYAAQMMVVRDAPIDRVEESA